MKTSAVVVVVNMFKLCSSSSMFMLGLTGVLVLNINSANGVNLAPVFDQNMNQHRIKENTPVGSVIYNLLVVQILKAQQCVMVFPVRLFT
jgi:hypothetical protein